MPRWRWDSSGKEKRILALQAWKVEGLARQRDGENVVGNWAYLQKECVFALFDALLAQLQGLLVVAIVEGFLDGLVAAIEDGGGGSGGHGWWG